MDADKLQAIEDMLKCPPPPMHPQAYLAISSLVDENKRLLGLLREAREISFWHLPSAGPCTACALQEKVDAELANGAKEEDDQ